MIASYYYCPKCQNFMDEHEALHFKQEIHYELDDKPTEWIAEMACIYCGNDDLEDAAYCDECGELFGESQLDENGLCQDCRKEAKKDASM